METQLILGMLLFSTGGTLLIGGACWWTLRRQTLRPPVAVKLLRAPGESLRRRIHAFDEEAIVQFLAALACPPFAVLTGLLLVRLLPEGLRGPGILLSFLLGVLTLLAASLWVAGTLRRRRNHLLGYFGERAVAEALQPLLATGHRVFHDVPALGRKSDLDIDHVVVGPEGVFAIETKTRRGRTASPEEREQRVTFDGAKLIWPWGEDAHGLERLEEGSVWLGQWLEQETGIRLTPHAVLCLPGWQVHAKGAGRVSVVGVEHLVPLVCQGRTTLGPDEIAAIAARLDKRCRDVTD